MFIKTSTNCDSACCTLLNGEQQMQLTAEKKQLCARGLKIYEALSPHLKKDFIERWKTVYVPKTWAGNKCNLGWIKEFEDTYDTRRYPTQGLFTRQSCTQLHACVFACIALGTCKPQELRHCACKLQELRHCIVRVCV